MNNCICIDHCDICNKEQEFTVTHIIPGRGAARGICPECASEKRWEEGETYLSSFEPDGMIPGDPPAMNVTISASSISDPFRKFAELLGDQENQNKIFSQESGSEDLMSLIKNIKTFAWSKLGKHVE